MKVALNERETTITYSVEDVRKGGSALLTTFDKKIRTAAIKAGGVVTVTGKTDPPYWCIAVPASEVRIRFKRKPKASPPQTPPL